MDEVSSWGKYPKVKGELKTVRTKEEAVEKVLQLNHWIPRGLARSYGDSSLAAEMLLGVALNRFISFDVQEGILTCEAGVSFTEIIDVFVPLGWFLPVTPGTKFITVGGAIASDVHGKNHHLEGSFSRHLISFELLIPSGEILFCSREQNFDVFNATTGGMGLTGFILQATFRLKKIETAYISQESSIAKNLDDVFKQFEAGMKSTYSVAWIDCMTGGKNTGRSILLKGEHARLAELKEPGARQHPLQIANKVKFNIPFEFPDFALNALTFRTMNFLYYNKEPNSVKNSIKAFDPYFYPLDSINNWNRAYGKRGFTQYQLVLPPDKSFDGLLQILAKIHSAKMGTFVTVLKYFGKQPEGLISFPMEGYTLALDFPVSDSLFPFLNQLDEIVLKAGGRLYLSKDSRMSPEMFRAGYPGLSAFLEVKNRLDPSGKIQSAQSKRLL